MFAQARNTLAQAALRYNTQLKLYKLVVAFNVTERNARGELKFPVPSKCAYVSGHFEFNELATQLQRASRHISTDNIVLEG
jgi:hypothetical protein